MMGPATLQDFFASCESQNLLVIGPMLSALDHSDSETPIVYVDSGVKFRGGKKSRRSFAVGDQDSHALPLDQTLSQKKDFSDLAFVLRNIPSQITRVDLLGFLGGRRDHELINLGETYAFLSRSAQTRVNFEDKILGFSAGEWPLNLNTTFSVVTLAECRLKITGACEYPWADDQPWPAVSSLGLSNRGFGDVHFSSSGAFFIFQGEVS